MPQQKSTSLSAAKVANFVVVMIEMVGRMSKMEKKIKRLRHHVSVLSQRNHQLMKDGKSWAAPSIASDTSLSTNDEVVEAVVVGQEENPRIRVEGTVVGEKAREKANGDGVPAPWCKKGGEEFWAECQERDRHQGRTKWKVATLNVGDADRVERLGVEAESVAEEVEEVAKPRVRLPSYENEKGKRRRV